MKKQIEIVTFTHKEVAVNVKINYMKGQISILENAPSALGYGHQTRQHFEDKKWVFANRELEYMEGWQTILDAIKFAVKQATALLKEEKEKNEQHIAELIEEATRQNIHPVTPKSKRK